MTAKEAYQTLAIMAHCYSQMKILEILKRNLYIEKGTGKFKGIEIIQCSLGSEHNKEDFNKIKEWLNENNQRNS